MAALRGSERGGDATGRRAVDNDIGGRGAERRETERAGEREQETVHVRCTSAPESACGSLPSRSEIAEARPAASPMGTALPVTR